MRSCKKGHELEELAEIWLDDGNIFYIWGAAIAGTKFLKQYKDEICIRKVFDSDPKKQGKMLEDREIVCFDQKNMEPGSKIIVCTNFYREVKQELIRCGFRENVDFIERKKFKGIRYYYKENKVFLYRVDLSVTNKCTLRCEKCNMLMPYFHNPQHKALEAVKQDLDLLFRWVDVVELFDILGGEPLLYPDLAEVLQYIKERYQHKIEAIHMFTNGTCVLNEELLKRSKEMSIIYDLSDYTRGLPQLTERVDEFESNLQKHGIKVNRDRQEYWLDFGYPETNHENWTEEQKIAHFHNCEADFRGLHNRKLYYCHLEASAVQAGLFEESEDDFVELDKLNEENKVELVELDQGYSRKGYPGFCLRCDGCGSKKNIPVAKQKGKEW